MLVLVIIIFLFLLAFREWEQFSEWVVFVTNTGYEINVFHYLLILQWKTLNLSPKWFNSTLEMMLPNTDWFSRWVSNSSFTWGMWYRTMTSIFSCVLRFTSFLAVSFPFSVFYRSFSSPEGLMWALIFNN